MPLPFAVKARVEGLDQVLKRLAFVEEKVRKKILRRAAARAGRLVAKRAKQLAPTDTKLLKKSIGSRVKVYRKGALAVAIAGPRSGFKRQVARGKRTMLANPVKYAHLAEHGTAPHGYKSRSGKHPGAKAHPFLAPATAGMRSEILKAVRQVVAEGLGEAATQAAARARGKSGQ